MEKNIPLPLEKDIFSPDFSAPLAVTAPGVGFQLELML